MSSSAGRKILIKLIKIIHPDVLASCGQETAFKVTSTALIIHMIHFARQNLTKYLLIILQDCNRDGSPRPRPSKDRK